MVFFPGTALNFAIIAHAGQIRKYNGDPYITHPIRVASLVSSRSAYFTEGDFIHLMEAAVLHDVIEDCGVTHEDLDNTFGLYTADLVVELSNTSKANPDLNRAERKEIDRLHIQNGSRIAKTIKCADRLDNLKDLEEMPRDFAVTYLAESDKLLGALVGAETGMFGTLKNRIDKLQNIMGED